jgi:hypothetical protein
MRKPYRFPQLLLFALLRCCDLGEPRPATPTQRPRTRNGDTTHS